MVKFGWIENLLEVIYQYEILGFSKLDLK